MELEVALILIQQTIEPREELLSAVVGVEDDGDAVGGSNAADVVSGGDTTGDGSLLAVIADTLSSEVGSTTLRELQNDRAFLITGSLEGSNHSGRGGHVLLSPSVHDTKHSGGSQQAKTYNGGDSEGLLLAVLEETEDVIASDDTGLAGQLIESTHFD